MLSQFFRQHPHSRLITSILLGLITALFLPAHLRGVTKGLIAWNISIWFYLMMIARLMVGADHLKVVQIAEQENERGLVALGLVSIAAVASLAAVVLELSGTKQISNFKVITLFIYLQHHIWFLVLCQHHLQHPLCTYVLLRARKPAPVKLSQ